MYPRPGRIVGTCSTRPPPASKSFDDPEPAVAGSGILARRSSKWPTSKFYKTFSEKSLTTYGAGRRSRIERHRLEPARSASPTARGAFFEIGPGHGTLGELAVAGGWDYTAIEASPLLMDVLKKKGLKVIPAWTPPMPMADASADVVYADQVLEHMRGIDDARQFTAEALRSLKPGGIFFVVVPDYLKERQFFWDVDYTHNFVTTERRIRQLFNDGGFEILHMERAIGLATGVKRDLLAAAAVFINIPGVDALVALYKDRRSRLQDPQESLRNTDLRREKAGRRFAMILTLRFARRLFLFGPLRGRRNAAAARDHRDHPGDPRDGDRHGRLGARDRGDRSPLSRARAGPRRDRSRGDDPAMGAAAARERHCDHDARCGAPLSRELVRRQLPSCRRRCGRGARLWSGSRARGTRHRRRPSEASRARPSPRSPSIASSACSRSS